MAQRVINRRIDPVEYTASGTTYADIPRGMLIRELYLELRGALTAATGNAINDANILPGDEWAIVREIRIIANSTQVLRKFSGEQLRMLNLFYYGNNLRASPLCAGVAAEATLTFRSSLRLPFWNVGAHTPIDSLLDTRFMSSLRIEVDWGTIASITSATSASIASVSLNLGVSEQDGDGKFAATRVYPILETAVAVNESKRIQLPVESMYRGLIINTKESDSGYPDAASAGTFLKNIRIQSGPTIIFDMPGSQVRDIGLQRAVVPTYHDDAGNAIDESPFASSGSFLNSWYFIDFLQDMYATELPDAVGLSEFVLELNVETLIDRLTILPLLFYPTRGK